jgi:C1A family cysteine protease
VAHAALSAYEHYLTVNGAYQDMSEQFLYWNCKQHDGIPNQEGTWLEIAIPLLHRDGVCLEATWNYNPTPIPANEGQGPPPTGARLEALSFRPAAYRQLAASSVGDIKAELAAGRCVAFSVPVYNVSFFNKNTIDTGDIIMPPPNTVVAGGHAMCFCGYEDIPANPGLGGGRFILRNSWNGTWGVNSPYGSGYGTIPYAYIAKFGMEAYSVV